MAINPASLNSAPAGLHPASLDPHGEWEVNINDAAEVRHWMQHWNVTEVELRKAVAEVGTDVTELRIALGR